MKSRLSTKRPPSRLTAFLEHRATAPILLMGFVLLVYANSLHGEFVFDDRAVVFRNPQLLNLKTAGEIFKSAEWREPLYVTYRLNYYLGGLDPWGYHLLSVCLHALNSVIVFYIVLELGTSRLAALAGSALFAAHPLLSGAVSYIAGRSSLLCGTFYFVAMLAFLKGLRAGRLASRILCFGIVAIAAALAWSTKQEAITLPAIMAAFLWIRTDARKWPYVAALALIPIGVVFMFRRELSELLATVARSDDLVIAGYAPPPPLPVYLRTYAAAMVGHVLPKFVWPVGLNIDPDVPEVSSWASPEFIVSACVIAGLVAAVLLLRKSEFFLLRVGLLGILVSPLAAYAVSPLADVIQEHRIYIAGLGFALIATCAAQWLSKSYGARSNWAVLAAVVAFGLTTINRNQAWASDTSLWEDAVRKSPDKPRPHLNLGQAYQRNERLADALAQYQIAAKLDPKLAHAKLNVGLVYLQQNDLDRARQVFEELRQTAPSFPDGWSNLGIVYTRLGQADRALEVLNRAAELKPGLDSILFARGDAYNLKGRYDLAIADYKTAISIRPDVSLFRLRLGATYMKAHDLPAAEQEFKSIVSDPKFGAGANRNLGLLRLEAGDQDGAIRYFQAALAQQNLPEVHHDLGLVYLSQGLVNRAIDEFRAALALTPDFELAVVALSQAYERLGRPEEARRAVEDFLNRFPARDSAQLREIVHRLQ